MRKTNTGHVFIFFTLEMKIPVKYFKVCRCVVTERGTIQRVWRLVRKSYSNSTNFFQFRRKAVTSWTVCLLDTLSSKRRHSEAEPSERLSGSSAPVCLWKCCPHCFLHINISFSTIVANVSHPPVALPPKQLCSGLACDPVGFLEASVVGWLSRYLHANITLYKNVGGGGYWEIIQIMLWHHSPNLWTQNTSSKKKIVLQ